MHGSRREGEGGQGIRHPFSVARSECASKPEGKGGQAHHPPYHWSIISGHVEPRLGYGIFDETAGLDPAHLRPPPLPYRAQTRIIRALASSIIIILCDVSQLPIFDEL